MQKSIQLVMLSKFRRSGGGRETWFYNFMLKLFEVDINFKLDVLGYRLDDSMNEIFSVYEPYKDRVNFTFFSLTKGKIPVFFKMWGAVHNSRKGDGVKKYDYVIAMGVFELIMILTSNYKGVKKVVWLRGIFLHEKANKYPHFLYPLLRKIEFWLLKKADYVFTIGEDIKNAYSAQELKINVVSNGVNLDKWKPKSDNLVITKPIKIAYVGRLSMVKGLLEYIESANQTLLKYPNDFEFHIVGDGELKHSKEFMTANPSIIYHGPMDNDVLPNFLRDFHICVALTFADENGGGGGTSNALLEEMALGLIIVAWNNEIFNQVLNDSEAYLIKQKDVNKMVSTYIRIKDNPEEAILKAKNGRVKAATYDINVKVKEYADYFI